MVASRRSVQAARTRKLDLGINICNPAPRRHQNVREHHVGQKFYANHAIAYAMKDEAAIPEFTTKDTDTLVQRSESSSHAAEYKTK